MCDGWGTVSRYSDALTIPERETWSMLTTPALSLWDCDSHGELFSNVSFSIQSLDLYCWRRQESWRSDQKFRISQVTLWHFLLLPRVQTRCSLHIVTLNILKFCQGHPPSTSTLTAIHLSLREDTGVTSINNHPDTIGDNCWWVCTAARLTGGARGTLDTILVGLTPNTFCDLK